jgi:hypothetical protein
MQFGKSLFSIFLKENHSFQNRSSSRPGFRVLIGSPGRQGQFFLKSKRRYFSKNKSQQVATKFLIESPGQPCSSFSIFFQFNPVPAPDRSGPELNR